MANQAEQRLPLIRHPNFGMQSPAGRMKRLGGLIHVRALTVLFGVAEMIFILIQALIAGSYLASSSHKTPAMIHMTVVVLAAIAVFLLLAGIVYRVPLLLGPHLVMQVTVTFVLLLLTLGSLICLLTGTSLQMKLTVVSAKYALMSESVTSSVGNHFNFSAVSSVLAAVLLIIAVAYFFSCLVSMWCFGVVLDCYRFLSVCQEDKSELPTVVTPALSSTLSSSEPKSTATSQNPIIPATDF